MSARHDLRAQQAERWSFPSSIAEIDAEITRNLAQYHRRMWWCEFLIKVSLVFLSMGVICTFVGAVTKAST